MILYLVQHGDAVSEDEDSQRPLSDLGRTQTEKTAAFAAACRAVTVQTIYHSGKLRAKQTAEIIGWHIQPKNGVRQIDGMAPNDDPQIWAGRLADTRDDIMLVGHLPHLSRLAALLLCGNSTQEVVQFQNAGIVCLERDIDLKWGVSWAMIPRLLA
jgi:phosphohistidine phosphatase